jgi:hypothetical protein
MESKTYGAIPTAGLPYNYACANGSYLTEINKYYIADSGLLLDLNGTCSDGTIIGNNYRTGSKPGVVTHTQKSASGFTDVKDIKYASNRIFAGLNFLPLTEGQAPETKQQQVAIFPEYTCPDDSRLAGFSGLRESENKLSLSTVKFSCANPIYRKPISWIWVSIMFFILLIIIIIIIAIIVKPKSKTKPA